MKLEDIRNNIDIIDDEILELFLRRIELSEQVAEYKKENSLPILNKEREREILRRTSAKAGENEKYAYQLFTKLFELSRARQSELYSADSAVRATIKSGLLSADRLFPETGSIACQGVEGSNSQAACDKLIPRGNILYVKTYDAVFNAVESGLCDYGVLPIENNTNGSVRAVYELLREKKFYIVRSTKLNIRHELLAKPGTRIEDITEIYSHEQAIGQCGKFLLSLGNSVRIIPCGNTAAAAKAVSESTDKNKASISSHICSELYGLDVISDGIQDNDNNYTKFICIAKRPDIYAGSNRISLIISCANKSGALNDILSELSARGINMSKLESCPVTGRNFEFIFYLELDADVREKSVIPMLESLERNCESFVFLGNYMVV